VLYVFYYHFSVFVKGKNIFYVCECYYEETLKKSIRRVGFIRFEISGNENYYADKYRGGGYHLNCYGDRGNGDNSQRYDKKGNKKYSINVLHKEKCKKKTAIGQ